MYHGYSDNYKANGIISLDRAKRILVTAKIPYYCDKHMTINGLAHYSVKPCGFIPESLQRRLANLADRVSTPVCRLAGTGVKHGSRSHNCQSVTRYIFNT